MFGKDKDEEVKGGGEGSGTGDGESEVIVPTEPVLSEEEQRMKDAEETNRVIRESERLAGEFVKIIVRHSSQHASGSIYVCGGAKQYYIKPDVEVIVPEWVVGALREPYHPVFDKEAKKQTNKPMYSVEVIEKGLTQYHFKNFMKEHAHKVIK